MANGTAKITRTFGTPTDRDKWTFSAWVKLNMSQEQGLFWGWDDASNYTNIEFGTTGKLTLYNHESGSAAGQLTTNRLFRDFSAWYHIVIVWDSGNVTAGDRIIFYVNGVRETSFSTENNPAQDKNSAINGPNLHELGAKYGSYDISGCMSHVQFVDGLALAPTEFGSTDATSGIWKVKTGCYATPGNNGFCLKMEDSSNLDLDSSSNANTFATTGTLTATKDNPSSSYATINALINNVTSQQLTCGNTKFGRPTGGWRSAWTGMADTTGKYYAEFKGTSGNSMCGVMPTQTNDYTFQSKMPNGAANYLGDSNYSTGIAQGGSIYHNGSNSTYAGSWTTGDIISIALDCTNRKVYFAKDGVWADGSGAWGSSTFDAAVGAIDLYAEMDAFYHFAVSVGSSTIESNFGNGYFGTTAVASAGTNGGEGIFEYNVPTGYGAMCTKGMITT